MDINKISTFIATARTEAGLTQKELADKIGVSDKTISKWETGKSLPDISYYETLCNALNIKVNELLSGEHLNEDVYLEKAETNFVEIIRENSISKKKVFARLLATLSLFTFTLIIIAVLSRYNFIDLLIQFADLPTFIILCFMNLAAILISGRRTMSDILILLRYISIPFGVLLTLISLATIPAGITEAENLMLIIPVCLIPTEYGIIEYIIASILSKKLN